MKGMGTSPEMKEASEVTKVVQSRTSKTEKEIWYHIGTRQGAFKLQKIWTQAPFKSILNGAFVIQNFIRR
ncbi:MAG: hypothetical protein ACLVCH_04185 [Roseburia inulinivorans]